MSIARQVLILFSFAAVGCMQRPLVETDPSTQNLYVAQVAQSAVDKIDLLFMVDNSQSMADKQAILREAVPVLVGRLTSPICVDSVTGLPNGESSSGGRCQNGETEFNPVNDIHVGIVTSSLGSHGAAGTCDSKQTGTPNDRARLLGTIRPTGSNANPSLTFDVSRTWNNTGFLAWDAGQTQAPPGESVQRTFQSAFGDMIAASGELGCGYEASLESWYRFLVDPEPPAQVTALGKQAIRGSRLVTLPDGTTRCEGCDEELLAQRKAFLRPDSLLAIVMLSDENDCSIRDDAPVGGLITSAPLPRATAACDSNPNDPCCRSCGDQESAPPTGCAPLSQDAVCKLAGTPDKAVWEPKNDHVNMRCFQQKKRFGTDFLYPVSRYVEALTQPTLTLQSDNSTPVTNPLYVPAASGAVRDPSQVFLAGIVGVPWQDIADEASLAPGSPRLKYLTAEELVAKDRWTDLLGSSAQGALPVPRDPFMIESPLPRAGSNPITGDPIVPESSMNPTASPINGHEQNVPGLDDLQFACTFELSKPKTCLASGGACDCAPTKSGDRSKVVEANSPLCQPEGGGAATTEQRFAKAYPGTRELSVLKGLNAQGIVASICPKVTVSANPDTDPNYGYNPAVAAIIERLKVALSGKCLPRPVQADPVTKQVQCKVVEAQRGSCDCAQPGRAPVNSALLGSVRDELASTGNCGGPKQPACSEFCGCEIAQEKDADLDACRNNAPESSLSSPGYCYIDDPASPALKNCPANEKRLLRFVSGRGGQRIPAPGAVAFIACAGEAVKSPM